MKGRPTANAGHKYRQCGISFGTAWNTSARCTACNVANWMDFTGANFSDGKYHPLAREILLLLNYFKLATFREGALLINHERTNGCLTHVYFRGRGRSREVHGWPSRDYDAGVYARRNHIGYHPATAQIEFPITRLSCRSNVSLP